MQIKITTDLKNRIFAGSAGGYIFNAFFVDGEADSLTLWKNNEIVFDYRHKVKNERGEEDAVNAAREILKILKEKVSGGFYVQT